MCFNHLDSDARNFKLELNLKLHSNIDPNRFRVSTAGEINVHAVLPLISCEHALNTKAALKLH